jgi:membrane-bound lytic murein transglycosylase MltF
MDPLDRMLFAFASYNAGPTKIRRIRLKADQMGLDPNRWFGNVEVAAAKVIGRETYQYVRNIFKYYISYKLIMDQKKMRDEARERM